MAKASPSYPATFKVALIQMNPKPLDPDANFATAAQYIASAARSGASLAVLPEYHLTGWQPEHESFARIAERAGDYVEKYQALAAELKINIVPGTIVQTAPAPAPPDASASSTPALVNIATFISYTGEVLGSYTKRNLWHPERPHLTALSSEKDEEPPPPHTVIETPLGPIGLLVCWDLAFPEAFRALVRQGAKIIIIPTFWMRTDCSAEGLARNPDSESLFLNSTLVARAFENTCAIVFVNVGGPEPPPPPPNSSDSSNSQSDYCGLSQVAMPLIGSVPGSFKDFRTGMRVVDVDMELIDIAEQNYKVRADLARDDWHYGYNK